MKKSIKIVFYSLILIFILLLVLMFSELISISPYLFPGLLVIFSVLGVVEFFLVRKGVEDKKMRVGLIINSISAFGVGFFAILHNAFYALSELGQKVVFANLLGVLEGTAFILAIVVSPILFVVTTVCLFAWSFRK